MSIKFHGVLYNPLTMRQSGRWKGFLMVFHFSALKEGGGLREFYFGALPHYDLGIQKYQTLESKRGNIDHLRLSRFSSPVLRD